ncbi:hypothetical protein LWI29_032002 [Acer saccharum]|uniref:F-box domain-containing protein n=1 Tax=Acer saccharum TaxID=4024 RepID=A0AA39T288_ACESA|nr:hypothetical protein LWI29_032002 [Acer saccharum]
MKKSDWADLPMEILRRIMENLFWSERLPSCLVCKTWHECFLEIQNEEQFLPWVMTMEHGGGSNLGDPAKQVSQIVEGATHDLLGYACASRYGWVLFSNDLDDYDNDLTIDYEQYILYSPFTNEVIKFPKLIEDYTSKATFSHSPGSPNCMVIVFSAENRKISIKTCQPGDKSWKIFETKGDKVGQVACVDDFVYCLYSDDDWKLSAFSIKQQELLQVSSGILPMNTDPSQYSLLVAFNGDILLQSLASDKTRSQYWRLDLSEDKWVVVEDEIMKKHVIFEGCTSFTIPAVRDARQSAGMVYSFNIGSSLSDFSCFPFDADLTLWGPKVRHHRWLNGDYKWLKEDHKPSEKIWIQPPFQRIWR